MNWVAQHISYQVQWQTDFLLFLQSLRSDPLSWFFYIVTNIGENYFCIAVVSVIFWCISKRAGYLIGFSFISADLLNMAFKPLFQIPRPIGHGGIDYVKTPVEVFPLGYSFPSGHSTVAGSFWSSAILALRLRWLAVIGVLMMILIPFSRLYFAAHTPIDVTAGLILGILTALIVSRIAVMPEKRRKYVIACLVFLFAAAGIFINHPGYWSGIGMLAGLTAGFFMERESIKMDMPKKICSFISRISVGLAGIAVLCPLLGLLLPESSVSGAFRYCCLGLWITAGAPALFSKFKI